MLTRKTIISLVVFGVLLALVLVIKLSPESREEIAWSIPRLDETLESLEITRKGETVTLEKKGEQWAVTKPKVYEVSKTALDGVLKLFEKPIGMDLKVVVKEEELEKFEVKGEKAITVKLGVAGKEVVAFVVGKTIGSRTFIKPLDQEGVIYRAKASLRWKLDKGLDDWREKKILSLEREGITRLVIRDESGSEIELNKEGEKWSITRPSRMAADGSTISSLLSSLSSVRAAAFADDVPADKTGFGESPYSVTVWSEPVKKEGEEETKASEAPKAVGIEIGGIVGKDLLDGKYEKDHFVRRGGEAQVFVVRSYSVKNLRKKLSELRDRKMLSLQRDQIIGLTLQSAERKIVLDKADDQWAAKEPDDLVDKLDISQVNSLLSALTSLRAAEVGPEGLSAQDTGLLAESPASGKVEIRLKEGEPKVLLLGKEKEGSPLRYYARLADAETIYLLNDYSAKKFLRSTSAFRKVDK